MKENTKLTGPIIVTGRGIGYFESDRFEEDIEIPEGLLKTALNGDEVEIAVFPKKKNLRQQGEVLRISKRTKIRFVGVLEQSGDFFFLKPDDRRMYRDIFVHSSKSKKAKDGDKVFVEIISWKDTDKSPEGRVIQILGRKGSHEVEMRAIVLERGFDTEFSATVEKEAQKIKTGYPKEFEVEAAKRRNFRGTTTFTIDPQDAKDFDDALSIKELPGGKYEIGIHIADVSFFVRPKNALDREARKRGFSVYLVDRTIPMLPETLSNELCSLNPNQDKLTFSAVFTMNENGEVLERWFGKTVIHSNRRFVYEEAQDILDKKRGDFYNELNILNRIAKKLAEKKFAAGAIDFEAEEIKFELDKDGVPVRIYKKERKDTHKLVEEFMLLANREVAEFMYKDEKKTRQNKSFIYRIHDIPDRDKIAELSVFIKALGYHLPIENGTISAKDMNVLLKQVDRTEEESLVKTAAIRSMAKAIYSTKNIGHFGLAFKYYTHFTSPIRRYPDLIVHRLFERYLTSGQVARDEIALYQSIAQDSSDKEISAAEAERASIKYKQVEYMLGHVGEEFNAVVSGVSEWGVYVEETETKAEGMVRMRDMTDDFYELQRENYAIVGTKLKRKFTLGDKVRVKLVDADLDKRTLDFVFV